VSEGRQFYALWCAGNRDLSAIARYRAYNFAVSIGDTHTANALTEYDDEDEIDNPSDGVVKSRSQDSVNTTTKGKTLMATRARPRKRQTDPPPDEFDFEDIDVDELDDLDIDDLEDLDIDDLDAEEPDEDDIEDEADAEDEDEIEDEADDDEEDFDIDDLEDDEDDEPEPAPKRTRSRAKPKAEPEDDDLDDLDDLDGDDEDEIEDKPAARQRKAPAKRQAPKAAPSDRPLTDAQSKMLKDAARLKNGAKVENIGQQRTAESLLSRGYVKYVPKTGKTRVVTTVAGKKVAAGGAAPAKAPVKEKAQAKPAARQRKAPAKRQAPNGGGRALPRGLVGVAVIAKHCDVHEETVRRVLRMNDDRFTQTDGRWAFTKDEAREVVREVRAYVKYTGGTVGRPKGSATALPEGKVGPATIAEMAGCHRNTVYNFLRRHEERFARFKNGEGLYLFTESQAQKIAAKLAG